MNEMVHVSELISLHKHYEEMRKIFLAQLEEASNEDNAVGVRMFAFMANNMADCMDELLKIIHKHGGSEQSPTSCTCCPINITTEIGVYADNTGCLASFADAMKWYKETGKVWSCHNNTKKPCGGFLIRAKEQGVDVIVNENTILINESTTMEEIYNGK